jgi:calcineurin-like phosphoesterase family protein
MSAHHFVADLHLWHEAVLRYDKRPFATIAQHDLALAQNCAQTGHALTGVVFWILGDVARTEQALARFMEEVRPHWRQVNLIRGNHDDRVAWKRRDLFDEAHEARYLRISPDVRVYLSHYAHRVWCNSHHGAFHLHGHSHGALPRWGRSMDAGANCIDYRPIHIDTVVSILEKSEPPNHHRNVQSTDYQEDHADRHAHHQQGSVRV